MRPYINCSLFKINDWEDWEKKKKKKEKRKDNIMLFYAMYNLGHNILEPYNVLVQIGCTTSKTKRDI